MDDKHGPGFIYLLSMGFGWYKIGRTAHPNRRLKDHRKFAKRYGYDMRPILLVEVREQTVAEKLFHSLFRNKRDTHRHSGKGPYPEWFQLDAEDIDRFGRWARYRYGNRIRPALGRWPI